MRSHRTLFVLVIVAFLLLQPLGIPPASAAQFSDCASQTEIPAVECGALVALYNSTNGAGWTNHTNWLETDTPSNWFGVTVSDGYVTRIWLTNNNLNGNLPPEMGNLSNLQTLILELNQLTDSIPPELGKLSNLQYLGLSDNQLTGSIPMELGSLPNLQKFGLSSNQLTGSIPLSFTGLTALQGFGATKTWLCEPHDAGFQAWKATVGNWSSPGLCYSISGQITQSGGSLPGVTISSDKIPSTLSGSDGVYTLSDLPPGYYTLTPALDGRTFFPTSRSVAITDTDLVEQNFHATGPFTDCNSQLEIPVEECKALVAFYNSTNGANWANHANWLETDTPSNWFGVTVADGHVTQIWLANNLIGNLPPELGSLSNLQILVLYYNQLAGSIPSELGKLSNLQYLTLHSNQLTGNIPPELGKLSNIQDIGLSSNQLAGNIPPELGNLSNLLYLDLSDNQLTGSIPSELGNLSNLQRLVLYFNQLAGSIPPELGKLSNLQYLVFFPISLLAIFHRN